MDDYTGAGYGADSDAVDRCIQDVLVKAGFSLDPTYTGKAFWGMQEYLKTHEIRQKKVLFLHTGGGPLFFDYLEKEYRGKV